MTTEAKSVIEIPIEDIPSESFDAIKHRLSDYTIGFISIKNNKNEQIATLLGSGTLVQVGDTRAILTAHHVLEVLPRTGQLGIILSSKLHSTIIDVRGLNYLKIARGNTDCDGPDIAAIVLCSDISTTIGATKSFINLDRHHERMLANPPKLDIGIWLNNGFIADMTVEEKGTRGYSSVKTFCMLSGSGRPDFDPVIRKGHDYISLPVFYNKSSKIPECFGGMSGGGLWQALFSLDPSGKVNLTEFLLSGVVFYQNPIVDKRSSIICHGRFSVYQVAYEAIEFGIDAQRE